MKYQIINFFKEQYKKTIFFVLGVLFTLIASKIFYKFFPEDPIIVKEVADSVRLIHEYKLPQDISNDSVRQELENKVKNLQLLNDYESQIKIKLSSINSKSYESPNLIITNVPNELRYKGYVEGSSSAFFKAECPVITGEYIDIPMQFFNSEIIDKIAFIKVNIDKITGGRRVNEIDYMYEVKKMNNFIRISNDLSSGQKYEIQFGFMFKDELVKKYPTFYLKKCYLAK
jgi:hypothetical protein